jgi:hypothetical protein
MRAALSAWSYGTAPENVELDGTEMNADDLLRILTQVIFLLIFVVVAIQAVRRASERADR